MDLQKIINTVGEENILIVVGVQTLKQLWFISYSSSTDVRIKVPCKIIGLRDNKIELQPIYDDFVIETFYISNLEKMMDEGHAQLLFTQQILNLIKE